MNCCQINYEVTSVILLDTQHPIYLLWKRIFKKHDSK